TCIRDGLLTVGWHIMGTARDGVGTLVLLCARFDNLERIREKLGEHAAQCSLREIATLLTRSFRRTDLMARIGESQFAALAVDAIDASARELLQRLRKRVEGFNSGVSRFCPLVFRLAVRFSAGR